jgi:hypothetical protein
MQALTFHSAQRESYVDRNGRGTGVSTPWGRAQTIRTYARGVKSVMTAGHGGIGITVGVANAACLSHPARKVAELKAGTFWFEEDCLFAVACWELGSTFWPFFFEDNGFEPDAFGGTALLDSSEYRYGKNEVMLRIGVRQYLAQTISQWNPEYLIERDEAHMLSEPQYSQWQSRRLAEEMRRDGHPNLVTSASRLSEEKAAQYGEGVKVVRVHTADGRYHDVAAESYASRSREANLLSECTVLASGISEGFFGEAV